MVFRTHLPESKRHEAGEDRKAANSSEQQPQQQRSIREERIARLKPWRFQPGQSGNPGGRPKRDVASEIARAIFENNPEAVYRALGKKLVKGDPYAFKELAERGYGKLKEKMEVNTSDEMLARLLNGRKRIKP